MYIRNSHIRTSFSLYFLQLADHNCIIVKRSFYFYLNARRLFWTTRLTRGFLYTKKPASKRRQLLLHCSLGLLPSLVILFCLDYIGFGIVFLFSYVFLNCGCIQSNRTHTVSPQISISNFAYSLNILIALLSHKGG